MSKKGKKPFRAYTACGKNHRMKHCDTVEIARDFLALHGGGIIERLGSKTIRSMGHGADRVEFHPPLRVDDWQFVERVVNAEEIALHAGIPGLRIESDYPLRSEWLPKDAFTKIYDDLPVAVATAIEGIEEYHVDVRIVNNITGQVVWRYKEEDFE